MFLICSDLLNWFRSVGTIVITTGSDQNSLKIISRSNSSQKPLFYCCFDLFSVQPPQIFQAQAKISTIRPVLPKYLSVSYEYEYINWFSYLTKGYDWSTSEIKLSCQICHKSRFVTSQKMTLFLALKKILFANVKILSQFWICTCPENIFYIISVNVLWL